MNKIILLGILLLPMTFNILAQDSISFQDIEWTDALEKSSKEGKLIFMEAYASWSLPCSSIERYAFKDAQVAAYFNENFINIRMDMEDFPGVELAELYEIFAYPGLLFFNGQGEVVHRGCGALVSAELLKLGQRALEGPNLTDYEKRFRSGEKSVEFLVDYTKVLEAGCADKSSFVEAYFTQTPQKEWMSEASWAMINLNIEDPYCDQFQFLMAYHDRFALEYGEDTVDMKIYDVLLGQFIDIYEERDITLFAIQALRNLISRTDFNQKNELSSLVDLEYADLKSNWPLFAEKAVRVVKEQQVENPDQLNEFAWKFYLFIDDPELLATAKGWMEGVLERFPEATYLDTYASLLYKTGDRKASVEYSQRALQAAELENQDLMHYQSQLMKFESGL